jgi:hypothetical protein
MPAFAQTLLRPEATPVGPLSARKRPSLSELRGAPAKGLQKSVIGDRPYRWPDALGGGANSWNGRAICEGAGENVLPFKRAAMRAVSQQRCLPTRSSPLPDRYCPELATGPPRQWQLSNVCLLPTVKVKIAVSLYEVDRSGADYLQTLMAAVVANLSPDDVLTAAAYLSSLEP